MNKIGIGQTPFQTTNSPAKIQKSSGGFGEVLKESIGEVNKHINESAALSEGIMAGEHSNIHETMIAMEKSGISFKLLTKVQTKVIDAYKEVMRMQL